MPIRFPASVVQSLVEESLSSNALFTIERALLTTPTGRQIAFTVDKLRRESLLTGLDDVGLTMKSDAEIAAWQAADRNARPWIWTASANSLG